MTRESDGTPTITAVVGDMNGPLVYWGPAARRVRRACTCDGARRADEMKAAA